MALAQWGFQIDPSRHEKEDHHMIKSYVEIVFMASSP